MTRNRTNGVCIGQTARTEHSRFLRRSGSSRTAAVSSLTTKSSTESRFVSVISGPILLPFLPLGAGILFRWREDLGDELDYGHDPSAMTEPAVPEPLYEYEEDNVPMPDRTFISHRRQRCDAIPDRPECRK